MYRWYTKAVIYVPPVKMSIGWPSDGRHRTPSEGPSSKHAAGSVLRPSTIAQGDIYIDSPFASAPINIATGNTEQSICSSDNFIGADTPLSQLKLLEPYDCFDMESYAIVRAIEFYSRQNNRQMPTIEMIKVVSDSADETLEDWNARLEHLRTTLCNALNDVLSLYE